MKDKCQASSELYSAIKQMLMPHTFKKGNNPTVQSTLNKLTAQNYTKLAPYVIEHANVEAVDTLLGFTIKQNAFCDLYVGILKDIHSKIDVLPQIAAYVQETHHMIREIHTLLVMSSCDEYDEFCDVIKKKQHLLSRVKTIVKMNEFVTCTQRGKSFEADLGGAICEQIRLHDKNEFSTETLIELLAELHRTDEHSRVCNELLCKSVSFKLKFKMENLMS